VGGGGGVALPKQGDGGGGKGKKSFTSRGDRGTRGERERPDSFKKTWGTGEDPQKGSPVTIGEEGGLRHAAPPVENWLVESRLQKPPGGRLVQLRTKQGGTTLHNLAPTPVEKKGGVFLNTYGKSSPIRNSASKGGFPLVGKKGGIPAMYKRRGLPPKKGKKNGGTLGKGLSNKKSACTKRFPSQELPKLRCGPPSCRVGCRQKNLSMAPGKKLGWGSPKNGPQTCEKFLEGGQEGSPRKKSGGNRGPSKIRS